MNYFDDTITGGIQLFTDDVGWIQTSLRGAIDNMLNKLAIDTNPNFIIQGAVPTIVPGVSCTVTAGYIYLNGEVLQVDAHVASWASSDVYAYAKVSTTDTSGNRTIKIGGGTAVPWLKDRGVCTDAAGSVAANELDVEGPTMLDKIVFGIGSASTTAEGLIELATSAETITGSDALRAVTPAGLQAKVASTTAKGIAELATSAETITGTDAARVVTPAGLQAKVSSETAKGIAELATQAETDTGTDDLRIVTPLKLRTTTFIAAQIPNLSANKITSDTLGASRLPTATTSAHGAVEKATDAERITETVDKFIDAALLGTQTGGVRKYTFALPVWDMDITASVNVAHGLSNLSKVTGMRAVVYNTAGNAVYTIDHQVSGAASGSVYISATNIVIAREGSGFFDSATFNGTAASRGYVHIEYNE